MQLVKLKNNVDSRGSLTAIEADIDIPFEIKRCYLLHHLEAARGGHAHRDTQQLVIAASGSLCMRLSNGEESKAFNLDSPTIGLLIRPMTWIDISEYSTGAVIVVLASTHYKSDRTIRSWAQYLAELKTYLQ
jgi:hypothetical protein